MFEDPLIGLIKGVMNKDEQAFQGLYEQTQNKVFQYLYRMTKNQHIAEDLLIDTFAEVWKSSGNFRGDSKVLTWMLCIARNLTMNHFRNLKINEDELDEHIAVKSSQFADCNHQETTKIIAIALNRLPAKHREILDLVFLQEMNYHDISQIIDVPVNTVKTRVFHAKEKMKNIISEMGIQKDDLI